MATALDLTATRLPIGTQNVVRKFIAALEELCGPSLLSVSLHGSALREDFLPERSDVNLVILVERLDAGLLQRLLEPLTRARRAGVAPVLVTTAELRACANAFPGKFMALQAERRVLLGSDALGTLELSRAHLRLYLEQEALGLLLSLRRRYALQDGHRLTAILAEWGGGFCDLLRQALVLHGGEWLTRDQALAPAAQRFGLDVGVLQRVRDLRSAPATLPPEEAAALFAQFLDAVTRFAAELHQPEEAPAQPADMVPPSAEAPAPPAVSAPPVPS